MSLYCAIQDSSGPPSFVFWYRDDHVVNYSDEMGISIVTNTAAADQYAKATHHQHNPPWSSPSSSSSLSSSNASNANASQSSAIVVTSGPEIVSSLHIKTVRPKDAGIYTCAPSNARNYTVVVHVIKGTHCLENVSILLISKRPFTI